MTDLEQKKAAKEFSIRWKDKGYEKGESQKYWIDLLENVLEISNTVDLKVSKKYFFFFMKIIHPFLLLVINLLNYTLHMVLYPLYNKTFFCYHHLIYHHL